MKQALDDVSVQLKKLSGRLDFLESHKSELFKDYADGKLSKNKYVEAKEDCLRESEKVKKQITELESKSNITLSAQNTSDFFNTVKRLSNITEVTADMLSLVDRIDVFDGNRIEIRFNFKDEFERIYSSIKN